MRYEQLERELYHAGHGARMDSRKLANNTYAERRDGGALAVRLHATDVVTLRPDGTVTLDTGGWFTPTTKDRMHTYAPSARVFSERGTWYVRLGADGAPWDEGETYPYADGFTYHADTLELSESTSELVDDVQARNAEDRATLRDIREYVRGFTSPETLERVGAAILSGELMGDCWYCLMRDDEGRTLGDLGDSEHLRSHMDESYYVPSLMVNAYREHPWGDWRVVLGMDVRDWSQGRASRRSTARRILSDYLKRRLLVGAHSKRAPGGRTPVNYYGQGR